MKTDAFRTILQASETVGKRSGHRRLYFQQNYKLTVEAPKLYIVSDEAPYIITGYQLPIVVCNEICHMSPGGLFKLQAQNGE